MLTRHGLTLVLAPNHEGFGSGDRYVPLPFQTVLCGGCAPLARPLRRCFLSWLLV